MKKEYLSIEEIKIDFNVDETEAGSVRSKLRVMQASIHPDKNGGSFANDSDEELFHKLSSAIGFIDNKENNGALVSVSAVTDLTKAVTELVRLQTSTTNNALATQINNSIETYRSKHKVPKIALSSISIAVAAVWVFPNTIVDHPVLGKWFDFSDPLTNIIWFQIFIATALYWIFTWRNEERQRRFQEGLKTEMVQNKIFKNFVHDLGKEYFTLEEFVEYLIDKHSPKYHSPLSLLTSNPWEIDMPSAHTIAEAVIDRAVKRRAILQNDEGKISTIYKLV